MQNSEDNSKWKVRKQMTKSEAKIYKTTTVKFLTGYRHFLVYIMVDY